MDHSEAHIKPIDHSRIPELDGIRAIAVWMVMIFHVYTYGWLGTSVRPDFIASIPSAIRLALSFGWLGVDVFFILSGFLITGILLGSRERPRYFRNFYGRRVLRIMPLYFAFVSVCFIFYKGYLSYFILSTFFAANLAPIFGIPIPNGPGVLWSLAVEEQFYLLWPLLVFLLSRRNLTALAITIIVITPVARFIALAYGMQFPAVYTFSGFRFDSLALGALLAIGIRSPLASSKNSYRLAACLVCASVLITLISIPFGLKHTGPLRTAMIYSPAQFLFAAGFVFVLLLQSTPYTAFLRHPFARLSGSLSYCLYLVHLALLDAYQSIANSYNLHPEAFLGGLGAAVFRGAVMIILAFTIALLSRSYLEEPFLRLKKYF